MRVDIEIIAVPKENVLELDNKQYVIDEVFMGQSSTSIKFKGVDGLFNSINFLYYHNGKEIDIYRSALTNPYMKRTSPLLHYKE